MTSILEHTAPTARRGSFPADLIIRFIQAVIFHSLPNLWLKPPFKANAAFVTYELRTISSPISSICK